MISMEVEKMVGKIISAEAEEQLRALQVKSLHLLYNQNMLEDLGLFKHNETAY